MSFAAMMALALALDAAIGWPDALFRRIGHPVVWIGALISALEMLLNRPDAAGARRRVAGTVTVGIVLAATVLPALFLQVLLPGGWAGLVAEAVLAWPLLAVRSLHDHVAAVARPLAGGDLAGAREAVARIVGRDPARLGREGIARAALESLAENASDGVVSPLFWGCVAGLPGLVAYKAVNTMDSMIGHRNARYEDFGKAAARLDDLVNLLPARLTGGLFVLASARPRVAFRCMVNEAGRHRSPNAGWPEAALAGALGIRLSGPRIYGDIIADEPFVNAEAPDPRPEDMTHGLGLYRRAMLLGWGLLVLIAVL